MSIEVDPVVFDAAKRDFYVDNRRLTGDVTTEFIAREQEHPPYGLVRHNGSPIETIDGEGEQRWTRLEGAMRSTMSDIYRHTPAPIEACPYHEALTNLGSTRLKELHPDLPELDRFRVIAAPGGIFAPALIVNLLKRMKAMGELHRAESDTATLAANSMHQLLDEPLAHPQQRAKAFMFTLAPSMYGDDFTFDRRQFLPKGLIHKYTTLMQGRNDQETISWNGSTEEFELLAPVSVANRTKGSEADREGEHVITYEPGTKLGQIAVDEVTIGCPGKRLAFEMWKRVIKIAVAENMWEDAEQPEAA